MLHDELSIVALIDTRNDLTGSKVLLPQLQASHCVGLLSEPCGCVSKLAQPFIKESSCRLKLFLHSNSWIFFFSHELAGWASDGLQISEIKHLHSFIFRCNLQ